MKKLEVALLSVLDAHNLPGTPRWWRFYETFTEQ
jgi:hypothetical protein